MADGPRAATSWPITKLFTAFRIAFDIKKLALAGAGVFATYLGWWVLCWIFYTSSVPQWGEYEGKGDSAWKTFQRDRARWNLLHRLAGPPTNDAGRAIRVDAGDFADNPDEYKQFDEVLKGLLPVTIDVPGKQLLLDGKRLAGIKMDEDALKAIKNARAVAFVDVAFDKDNNVVVGAATVTVEDVEALKKLRAGVKPLSSLPLVESQMKVRKYLAYKPAGKYRVCPWNEDRGQNPYLLVADIVQEKRPFPTGGFFDWLLHNQLPILVEPLVKFVSPVYFLFHPTAGGFRIKLFLILIILWNLAVWGYFGGAICRLAAVQFARNEKIPLGEAVGFVNERFKHFFLAPLFPLGCLIGVSLILGILGFLTGWTHFFGDIVIAGLLWPLTIVFGLIMAVLLVGLFAWPLMYPTIAVEGSDSFDALSRSYSYLFQAPWQFLAYVGTSLLYGAALVFFVGFMGSLTVYFGAWGFGLFPGLASENPASDRTPVYLFVNAPTSFGWRDLFLHDSEWAQPVASPAINVGSATSIYELKPNYVEAISWNNRVGGWLVTLWLSLTFLLVVGFGYSYFWTASTIVYFLMRKKVDDTDLDEIHLDEDDVPPPPPPQPKEAAPATPVAAPAAAKPGTVSLNVVEPPK